ncbi:MAG: AarF/ABC1/UbiB kinase family protein, partial [Microbacteriaceae bacterium]|nr:AarF/ABC1/UbiB kinase family protein [Microbacteriaceae bacterium]
MLVIRSMTLTSGVASALDPAFNSWNSVEPYAATVLRVERGNIVQDLAREALDVASIAERTPGDWTHSSRTSKTAGCRSTGRDKSGRWLGATAPL